MATVEFKYGTLIRTGERLKQGGKWDATLKEEIRNERTNADLAISISINFRKIDPPHGHSGTYRDGDNNAKPIQKWAVGEFERFTHKLLQQAQRFWDGVFWLETPSAYQGLNWPDKSPKYRCNLYCRFQLERAANAHYDIDLVRVPDNVFFRSYSTLYSSNDIRSENLIRRSTVKFWTHYHEVGHLLGLLHVGHGKTHALGAAGAQAYGVTRAEMEDVMGMGSHKHLWHAGPWQEAAASFTDTRKADWKASFHRLPPLRLA